MGFYAGTGKAQLANANSQNFMFNNDRPRPGTPNKAGLAFQLERQKSAAYPFGFAVELSFSGAPGVFEVDIQGAENDQDSSYVNIGSPISAVNGSNVARFDGVSLYPKYVRPFVKTLTNDVQVTAVLTR